MGTFGSPSKYPGHVAGVTDVNTMLPLRCFVNTAGTALTSNGVRNAFTFLAGTNHNLNDLISPQDTNVWVLNEANAIIAIPTGIVSVEVARRSRKATEQVCERCGQPDHLADARYCHQCGNHLPVPPQI